MSLPNSPGIYCITNIELSILNIGSAVNLRKMWCQHKSQLSNNFHDNPKLQRSWNKRSEESIMKALETRRRNQIIGELKLAP